MGPWTLNVPLTFDFPRDKSIKLLAKAAPKNLGTLRFYMFYPMVKLKRPWILWPLDSQLTWPAWKISVFSEIWQEQNRWGFSNGHVRFFGTLFFWGACRWSKNSQVKSEKKNWNWEGVPYLKDSWPSKGLRQTEIAGWTKTVLWSTILTLTKPIWSRITTLISEWLMDWWKYWTNGRSLVN